MPELSKQSNYSNSFNCSSRLENCSLTAGLPDSFYPNYILVNSTGSTVQYCIGELEARYFSLTDKFIYHV